MRILVTINCVGVDASAAGGIAIGEMMSRMGHSVIIQAPKDGPVSDAARKLGLDVKGPGLRKSSVITGLLPFRRLTSKFRPDVIIATRADGQTAAAITSSGIPLARVRCDIRKPKLGRMWEYIDRKTDLVVFPSGFMMERGYASGRRGSTRVIPHPVDTDMFSPFNHRDHVIPRLISIGRLSPVKGHRTLIRALSILPESITATIIGPSSQQNPEDLLTYAAEFGVQDRLELLGRLDDVKPILDRGGIGVVTSLGSEVVSRAGMEIMSMSLPLLAASTNGLLDLVEDGETGLLHSPGNHRQLAAQVEFLMENPSVALSLGRGARRKCLNELSFPAVGSIWEAVLADLA